MKGWATIFILLLLTGCATSTTVSLHTDPPGGQVRISETGEVVAHGGSVDLEPGWYRFSSEAEGYRGDTLRREIPRSSDHRITVPLGMGFAAVEIRALPEEATIEIGDEGPAQGRIRTELSAGRHTLEVSLEGYRTHRELLHIEPGREVSRSIELEAVPVAEEPSHGRATVTPEPESARVFFQGRDLGVGSQELEPLTPGTYSVAGVRLINNRQRLTGAVDFTIEAGDERVVALRVNRRERRFEGEWLSEVEALRREQRRYRQQRSERPFAVQMEDAEAAVELLRERDDLGEALMAMLRVGDRVTLKTADETWQIWKRHREQTADFAAAVAALQRGGTYASPWADDSVEIVQVEDSGADPLATLVLALHRARAPNPLLDLHADQFAESAKAAQDRLRVARNRADGQLTVLVHGGEAPALSEGTLRTFGDLHFATLAPGRGAIELNWEQRPERVLVISDRPGLLRPIGEVEPLLLEQRRWLSFLNPRAAATVTTLQRFAYGPEVEGGWSHRVLRKGENPLDFQLDLTGDAIGPHKKPGLYQRAWILEYKEEGEVTPTQRQVQIQYRVHSDAEDGVLDDFLRRIE
ncbi:PEGA domain-containing protein [Halorhodospira abdelmalekii]|uniref:PEGA domain-containing protein n=1 Tax=Halorhodospira abdelmalekii TaxID=421629 RepID=UPI001902F51E|nr:PEGA domain-containing protein [Halorhodospira abdelmalekii]